MALSSNCVIHLTGSLEVLFEILRENFFLNYCTEEFACGTRNLHARIPMVSFCDIPLSEIKDHIGKYGEYGLGLSKEWAKRCGLNPVLYVEQNSLVSTSIATLQSEYLTDAAKNGPTVLGPPIRHMLQHVKNYEGPLNRNGISEIYRFSDEREWRYVPQAIEARDHMRAQFSSVKAARNSSGEQLRLTFEPNDIRYIIIKEDSEIERVVNALRQIRAHFSLRDVERLTTRILTAEQIRLDV